jgi:hypothetical protein
LKKRELSTPSFSVQGYFTTALHNQENYFMTSSLPIYNHQEADSTVSYLEAVKEGIPVWDWEILCYRDDDPTGSFDMWDNPKSRFFKSLVHFVSLGGIIPQSVYQANRDGKLFTWSEEDSYGWSAHLPKANETGEWVTHDEGDKEFKPSSNLQGATILYKKLSSSERKLLNKLKSQFNLRLMNLHDIYSEKVAETDVTEESIITYIKSLNGKMNENGWWVIKFKKYTLLEVKLEKGIWYYREGTQDLVLRNYHTISGIVPVSKHSVMLAVLNFLLTSKTEEDLRGRRAFMANVFVDKIYVGYSHKLLDKANSNKVGCIQLGLSDKNHFSLLVSDGNLVGAAKAYEKLGYSVFMHKGGKYIVVEAECVGFTRNDDKTQVAWYADKHAKLTGRALFMVATAAEYIEDEE